ncbi:MAG: ParB/RepB/Spo0J family partition protein [Lachnospiraceae bacterium]|nr:ParB/RepB/Spo0J family partition protein [Lachnospiraceae bacterium]
MEEKRDNIINIDIEQIYPHPDNPRKEIGDVTELAESIKKNGIMQNLTVIPGHHITSVREKNDMEDKLMAMKDRDEKYWELRQNIERGWSEDGYTLLIGHRRHAAAKLAGVSEVPCRIVYGMSVKEQVSTMLEENMQRNDLTIYEQAQGFQMMLDLGETEETIAEKIGFSKTTIRHRLNIAKLDQAELKKKDSDDGFQLTLKDLYELEKIKDVKTRNKILKESSNSRDLVIKAHYAVAEARRM